MNKLNSIVFRRIVVILAGVLLVITTTLIPFEQNLHGPCIITSISNWCLSQNGSGQISGIWRKTMSNDQVEQVLYNINRPDIVNLKFNPGIKTGSLVNQGDTIATLTSSSGISELKVLEAELERALAERSVLTSGGRIEDLEVEKSKLSRYTKEVELFEPEYQRIKDLYDSNLSSLAEMQAAESQLEVLKSKLNIARASVRALEAGEKPEEIQVAEAEIQKLRELIQKSRDIYGYDKVIKAPFKGRLRIGEEENVLCSLSKCDSVFVAMNFPEVLIPQINIGSEVYINLYSLPDLKIKSKISAIKYSEEDSVNVQVMAMLPNDFDLMQCGMKGIMIIDGGKTTFFQRLKAYSHSKNSEF